MLEDVVVEPPFATGEDQLEIVRNLAALLEYAKRVHQSVEVLAWLDHAEGDDKRRIGDAELASCTLERLLIGDRFEALLHAAGYDGNGRRTHAKQYDEVVSGVLGVGDDEVRPAYGPWNDFFKVCPQAVIGKVGPHQKG